VAWTKVPFYVVGKGTAGAFEEFRELCSNLSLDTKLELDLRGQESGTGEQLAHFILGDISKSRSRSNNDGVAEDAHSVTLLYLTGDKNRDTIPKILSASSPNDEGRTPTLNIDLDEVQVYETHGASDFENNLSSLMTQPHKGNFPSCLAILSST
jgi:uroporphyrinogen-III synthase